MTPSHFLGRRLAHLDLDTDLKGVALDMTPLQNSIITKDDSFDKYIFAEDKKMQAMQHDGGGGLKPHLVNLLDEAAALGAESEVADIINQPIELEGKTLLATAVFANSLDAVEELLSRSADPNTTYIAFGNKCFDGMLSAYRVESKRVSRIPLDMAVERGNVAMVDMLLKHGADVNRLNHVHGNRSALCTAVKMNYLDLVVKLIEAKADLNVHDLPAVLISPFSFIRSHFSCLFVLCFAFLASNFHSLRVSHIAAGCARVRGH